MFGGCPEYISFHKLVNMYKYIRRSASSCERMSHVVFHSGSRFNHFRLANSSIYKRAVGFLHRYPTQKWILVRRSSACHVKHYVAQRRRWKRPGLSLMIDIAPNRSSSQPRRRVDIESMFYLCARARIFPRPVCAPPSLAHSLTHSVGKHVNIPHQ